MLTTYVFLVDGVRVEGGDVGRFRVPGEHPFHTHPFDMAWSKSHLLYYHV